MTDRCLSCFESDLCDLCYRRTVRQGTYYSIVQYDDIPNHLTYPVRGSVPGQVMLTVAYVIGVDNHNCFERVCDTLQQHFSDEGYQNTEDLILDAIMDLIDLDLIDCLELYGE
jgi:hypothetical protein